VSWSFAICVSGVIIVLLVLAQSVWHEVDALQVFANRGWHLESGLGLIVNPGVSSAWRTGVQGTFSCSLSLE
jgi:hypothetical protein